MRVLVDTNVLVYAVTTTVPEHLSSVSTLSRLQTQGDELVLTAQILREYVKVITADAFGLSSAEAVARARRLRADYAMLPERLSANKILLGLVETYSLKGKIIHDANIVAVMLDHGVTTIVTHNARDFTRFSPEGIQASSLS